MEEAFRALLTGDVGVTAIASQANWGEHPQGVALPAVVLNVISGSGGHTLDGPDALFDGRIQVDCYAHDYGTAKRLSRAVLAAVDGHTDETFQGIFWATTSDSRDTAYSEVAERPFRVRLDFMVMANV